MKANRPRTTKRSGWAHAGVILIALAALAGCVPASSPPPRAARAPVRPRPISPRSAAIASIAPASVDWRDLPATPGDWTWASEAGGSTARFAGDLLTVRCTQGGRVVVTRGEATTATSAVLTITTTATTRPFTASPISAPVPALAVTLAAGDPLLDAMAFSRGRFMVTAAGLSPLLVPSWPEIGRVVEDCR